MSLVFFFFLLMYSVYNVLFFSGIIVVIIINIVCFVHVFCAIILYDNFYGSVCVLITISIC